MAVVQDFVGADARKQLQRVVHTIRPIILIKVLICASQDLSPASIWKRGTWSKALIGARNMMALAAKEV
jgi:hypothetical protein